MPHSYPFIPAEFVHGIESFSPRCMGWAPSPALLRFELSQGWEAAMLGGTYDCASSETGSPIGLQLFALPERTTLSVSDKVQQYARELKGMKTCQGCNQKAASL